MPKFLVTGATGFVGAHVARLLVERGDDVRLGVVEGTPDEAIRELDCERVRCDALNRRVTRRMLEGVDRVFHCSGASSVHPADAERAFTASVTGTKNLLEECLRAGVERVVYTSSAGSVGPAEPGHTADESQLFTAGRLGIPYVSAVHEAEVEAMRLAAKGLPLVCVNPTVTFGAGDYEVSSTWLVRSFLLGDIPVYTDGAVNVVDVRDVAQGHLLADQHGAVGERYILGGRNFTLDRLFADLGRLSGIEPAVKVPAPVAAVAARAAEVLGQRWLLTPEEVAAASQWWTYRSTKARRELGWRARPHEETLEATVSWHLEREHDRIKRTRRSTQFQRRVAGAAIGAIEGAIGAASQLFRRSVAPLA
jgi:dihydroflavonol-4-reductase